MPLEIRFGIMGAGKIAHKFCQAMNGIKGNLYAIASRDRERAQKFQKKYDFATMYASYGEMLADPNVDCVYVATPHGLHYEQMLACLRAGKHILCEKAFTLNRPQAEEVFQLARERGLFVMEAMWTRFLPAVMAVRQAVRDGEIGEIVSMEATFAFHRAMDPADRLFNPALGGGALLDIGIYPITLANLLLGIPDRITAQAHFSKTQVDATDQIVYEYPNAKAVLVASIERHLGRKAKIVGTQGTIRMPGFWATETATIFRKNGTVLRKIRCPHPINGMEYEIEETIRCIQNHQMESPIMTHAETLEILRQMDEIRGLWNFRYPQENR